MKNPSYTYENVQIGNFLVAMGYSLREKNIPLCGSINLFQQTPNDTEIGDVFGGLHGRYFILEFKRDSTHLNSELNKEVRVRLLQKIGSENDELFRISFKSHLMVHPSWKESNQLNYKILPYLKALEAEAAKIYKNPFDIINSPRKFVDQLYNSHSNLLGCSIKKMEKYIDLLRNCNSTSNSSGSNRSSSTCGLMFYADPNKGEMQSYKFESLDGLHLEIQKTLAITVEISKQQKIELEDNIRKKRELNKGKDKGQGYSMGM